jgi:hypothetical protein
LSIGPAADAVLDLGLGPAAGVERACFRVGVGPRWCRWRWRVRPEIQDGRANRPPQK